MQTDLFACDSPALGEAVAKSEAHRSVERFDLPDAELMLINHWCSPQEARKLFLAFSGSLAWEQSIINVYGRSVAIPRLNAWYGDPGSHYRYSGAAFDPLPWSPLLLSVKSRIERELGCRFNSVLANLYRDGRDSVSWHADNEPELGKNPIIASLSLGEERTFLLKHRRDKSFGRLLLPLKAGSLLIMAGETQHHWVHSVPKSSRELGARVNLTFRKVTPTF